MINKNYLSLVTVLLLPCQSTCIVLFFTILDTQDDTELSNSTAIICAHNHPSGVCEPSHADETITKRIKDACGLMDIKVLDHLIVSGKNAVSLAERGLI